MRWTVAICALLGLAAMQDTAPRIHKQGEIELYDAHAADLDQDREFITVCVDCEDPIVQPTESFKSSDFWFQAGKRRYFHPQHGARFSRKISSEVSYSDCTKAAYQRGAIRVDNLSADAHICLRTSEGRYASLQVKPYIPGSGRLSIVYTTWEKDQKTGAVPPSN